MGIENSYYNPIQDTNCATGGKILSFLYFLLLARQIGIEFYIELSFSF